MWTSENRPVPRSAFRASSSCSGPSRPPGPGLKYERMVSASTRRLPSTTIELTALRDRDPRGAHRHAVSADKDPSEDQAAKSQPPNNPHTNSHALRALLIHAAAPTADSTDGLGWHRPALYSVFYALQTKLPHQLSLSPQKVAREQRSRRGEVQDVIKGCKNHQHHDDRKANSEPNFLSALGQRPATNRLDTIEQKVTAIEERNRKQVQKAN